jgi:hypothetical protein
MDILKINFAKIIFMPKVEIYKLNNDGSQTIIATCALDGEKVVCEGENKTFIDNLEKDGITDHSSEERKKLYPKDGLKFLEQLQYNFKSGYLNASEVK